MNDKVNILIKLERIVDEVTSSKIRNKNKSHKNVVARSIFYRLGIDYLIISGMMHGHISYVAKYLDKHHATLLHSLKNFDRDVVKNKYNYELFRKCRQIFLNIDTNYEDFDDKDIQIDYLKNKIIDLELQLKTTRPTNKRIKELVDMLESIPNDKMYLAKVRIEAMIKGFSIEPKNQQTQIIGAYETFATT
jgi:hypothetical protein